MHIARPIQPSGTRSPCWRAGRSSGAAFVVTAFPPRRISCRWWIVDTAGPLSGRFPAMHGSRSALSRISWRVDANTSAGIRGRLSPFGVMTVGLGHRSGASVYLSPPHRAEPLAAGSLTERRISTTRQIPTHEPVTVSTRAGTKTRETQRTAGCIGYGSGRCCPGHPRDFRRAVKPSSPTPVTPRWRPEDSITAADD